MLQNRYFLPIATTFLAIAIFVADTYTGIEVTASFFYVSVVLLAVRFLPPWRVPLVTAVCLVLTVISYVTTPIGAKPAGIINTGISMAVLILTTYLVLQAETARTAAKSLAETEQLRDALLGSVSHELRTPLTSIVGGVSILADAPLIANDARLASLANGIRDEGMRLNADIQNLLDAARITSQNLHSLRDWSDPSDIIMAAVQRIGARYGAARIDLTMMPDLPLIFIDPVLVEQALGQIIANAAKFSEAPAVVRVAASVADGQLVIAVRDTGAGLTADERTRVTERFYRGERHVGKIPGSGLGLWIANTFITASGGRLEALSPGAGQGTTMRITFPNTRAADETEIASQDR